MSERQAIIFALKAIASALSLCDTDMALAMRDRLDAIHEAIDELANDDSAPEKVVNSGAADVTTESCDSREKLEADVRRSLGFTVDDVFHWLDRQAAITEREQQAKVDELTGQLEQSRKLIGDMLDAADAIRLLGGSYGD